MEYLIIIAVVLVIAFPLGLLNEKHKKAKEKVALDAVKQVKLTELRKELWQKMDEYNQHVKAWRQFYEEHKKYGEPTTSVGYSLLEGYEPWNQPTVTPKVDESDPSLDTQIKWTMECLAVYPVTYHLPDIEKTATFWKDAKIAIIGGYTFTPEELRFIKSRADKALDTIIISITTTNIECPMITIDFPYDDRETVDELKAAFRAFKELA